MINSILSDLAREKIHKAVQKVSPFKTSDTQAKVNMGIALETKQLNKLVRQSRPGITSAPDIYSGTANPNTVAKNRAKNKVARKSRRANR